MRTCAASLFEQKHVQSIELAVILALLLCINIPLIFGRHCSSFAFMPDRVSAGAWWRVLTYPFAHLSWYHLILDGSAFLLLYHGLSERSWTRRAAYAAICAAGSLAVSMLSPAIWTGGLCGLSGAAHGLMAVSALEMATAESGTSSLRRAGLIGLFLVVGKSIIEAVTGQVMFASLHFGDLGTPLTLSHAGGALAGIIAFVFLALRPDNCAPRRCAHT